MPQFTHYKKTVELILGITIYPNVTVCQKIKLWNWDLVTSNTEHGGLLLHVHTAANLDYQLNKALFHMQHVLGWYG